LSITYTTSIHIEGGRIIKRIKELQSIDSIDELFIILYNLQYCDIVFFFLTIHILYYDLSLNDMISWSFVLKQQINSLTTVQYSINCDSWVTNWLIKLIYQ